jgi:hypothetical protein
LKAKRENSKNSLKNKYCDKGEKFLALLLPLESRKIVRVAVHFSNCCLNMKKDSYLILSFGRIE